MNMIQAYQSRTQLSFRVIGGLFQQIKQWSYSIDEKVFNEQLATGRFRNWELEQDMLALMNHVKQQGGILPYYGAGGSSGACSYHFHLMPNECKLSIVHHEANEKAEFLTPYTKSTEAIQPQEERRFKFSPFPHFVEEKLPPAWSGQPPEALSCTIVGREFDSLSKWQEWVESLALTELYTYEFGEVSMGATGFAIKVHNLQTKNVIDITDYEDW
jgi:hypothetical protein